MFVAGNFLASIGQILDTILSLYMWVVIINALLSWVNPDPFNPIVRFVHNITEPVLFQIRKRIPVHFGGIDIAPVIVILGIYFLRSFIVNSLLRFSTSLM